MKFSNSQRRCIGEKEVNLGFIWYQAADRTSIARGAHLPAILKSYRKPLHSAASAFFTLHFSTGAFFLLEFHCSLDQYTVVKPQANSISPDLKMKQPVDVCLFVKSQGAYSCLSNNKIPVLSTTLSSSKYSLLKVRKITDSSQ